MDITKIVGYICLTVCFLGFVHCAEHGVSVKRVDNEHLVNHEHN